MKKLHLLVVLVAGTMAFYFCQKLIDLVPKKTEIVKKATQNSVREKVQLQ